MKNLRSFLRYSRDGGFKSALGFLQSSKIKNRIRTTVDLLDREEQEIHVLVGSDRVSMALWMAHSWNISTQKSWNFVFHDDGSLLPSQASEIENVLSGATVILDEKANNVVHAQLSRWPLCLQCRNLHPLGRKLFDFFCFTNDNNIPVSYTHLTLPTKRIV